MNAYTYTDLWNHNIPFRNSWGLGRGHVCGLVSPVDVVQRPVCLWDINWSIDIHLRHIVAPLLKCLLWDPALPNWQSFTEFCDVLLFIISWNYSRDVIWYSLGTEIAGIMIYWFWSHYKYLLTFKMTNPSSDHPSEHQSLNLISALPSPFNRNLKESGVLWPCRSSRCGKSHDLISWVQSTLSISIWGVYEFLMAFWSPLG